MNYRKRPNPEESIDSRITAAVDKRLKGVHPNARTKVSKYPKYLSAGLTEYNIRHDGSLWYIVGYKNPKLPKELQGKWSSVVEAENRLINYLRRKDKFNRAIYPGAPCLEQ